MIKKQGQTEGNLENRAVCDFHHSEVRGRKEKCSFVVASKSLPMHQWEPGDLRKFTVIHFTLRSKPI